MAPRCRRGRRPTLVAVAFVAVLAATASCRQILGISDPPRRPTPRPCSDPLSDRRHGGRRRLHLQLGRTRGGVVQLRGRQPGGDCSPGEPFIPSEITDGKRGASRRAARFSGSGFSRWGAILASISTPTESAGVTYNAAAASALKFWMKSNAPSRSGCSYPRRRGGGRRRLRRDPGQNNCNQHFKFDITAPANKWTEYIVPFSALSQPGSARWDPAKAARGSVPGAHQRQLRHLDRRRFVRLLRDARVPPDLHRSESSGGLRANRERTVPAVIPLGRPARPSTPGARIRC